jgi:fructoselysine 6-kinase
VSATERVRVDAVPAPVIDTCGAGDSFVAAFVLAALGGRSLEQRMHAAAAAAAATCGHLAAWPQDLQRAREKSL